MMKTLTTILLALLLLPNSAHAAKECTGSTEELLQCYAPEVKVFLHEWVKAWGSGDIETYLARYSSNRSPRSDLTRAAWEQHRRDRVSPDRPVEINLKLESMGLEDSGIFDVIFSQQYRSPTYQDEVRKRLFLARESVELKIWKEEVLP